MRNNDIKQLVTAAVDSLKITKKIQEKLYCSYCIFFVIYLLLL